MNFFSKVLKQKKLLVFILIFLVFSGIFVPQAAKASWSWLGCSVGGTAGAAVGIVPGITGCIIGGTRGASAVVSEVSKPFVYATGRTIFTFSKYFLRTTAWLFEEAQQSVSLKKSITRDPVVIEGWTIVRDFANMFVVLGFVIVGISTILKIREYEAQKKLLPLIAVAILINFSLLFCGVIIDGTNIAMDYFLNPTAGPGVGATALTQPIVNDLTNSTKSGLLTNTDEPGDYLSLALALSTDAAITGMIFLIYAILFLFRHVALMCLVMLAPLGFVCYVFPATHGIYKKWWEQFTQWAIIGIPTGFFIYIGAHLGQNMSNSSDPLSFWIPAVFLLFAYSLIFQTSALGASAAIGLATGAVGYAWGATKGLGKGGAKLAGKAAWNSRPGQAARGAATRFGERIGLPGFSKGGADIAEQADMAKTKSRVEKMSTSDKVALSQGKGQGMRYISAEGRRERAAAAVSLAEKGDFHLIPQSEREKVIAHATSYSGINRGVFKKSDYRAAEQDKTLRDKIKLANPTFTEDQITTTARQQQLSENLHKGMSDDQIRDIDLADITPELMERDFTPKTISAYKTADRAHIRRLEGHQVELIRMADEAASSGNTRKAQNLRGMVEQIQLLPGVIKFGPAAPGTPGGPAGPPAPAAPGATPPPLPTTPPPLPGTTPPTPPPTPPPTTTPPPPAGPTAYRPKRRGRR